MAVGGVGTRDQDDSAGQAIQAVHDAGPLRACDFRQGLETMQQRVYECSGMPAGAGMNHHARGFIDGNHIGVLIQDFERQLFGLGVKRCWRRGIDLNGLRPAQKIGRLLRGFVDTHAAGLDPCLQAGAAIFGQTAMQIEIEPLIEIVSRRFKMDHEHTTSYIQEVIRSAIVPVAGVGTRLLPATKSQPKEMLPVARKPIVQYVAEELVANRIDQILFVTGRNKTSIENHFDDDPELVRTLSAANRQELLKELTV